MTAKASVLHMPEPEAAALIKEGAALKSSINQQESRLREINFRLCELASFAPGKKTAHLDGNGLRAKIQLKTYVKFDQEKVAKARFAMGDEAFSRVFGWTYKPRSQRDLDGFMAHGPAEQVALVRDAMTVSDGAPQVTFEAMEA